MIKKEHGIAIYSSCIKGPNEVGREIRKKRGKVPAAYLRKKAMQALERRKKRRGGKKV